MATTDQWRTIEGWAEHLAGVDPTAACLLDLRRRIEALEAQLGQPAQAEQGQEARPLWRRMDQAFYDNGGQDHDDWVAVMDAVADWLSAGHPTHATAANALRAEARCTQEGRRG